MPDTRHTTSDNKRHFTTAYTFILRNNLALARINSIKCWCTNDYSTLNLRNRVCEKRTTLHIKSNVKYMAEAWEIVNDCPVCRRWRRAYLCARNGEADEDGFYV